MRHTAHHTDTLQLSPAKKKIFLLFTVSLPFVLLALIELLLRIFHYGPNLELFTRQQIGDKVYLVINQDVKGRYFSHVDFSPNTSPDFFQAPKPPGTFRIFFLGGSTTVGFPYGFCGSFSSFLRDRLHRLFPQRNIEVINLGMTATNSYTTNDIAAEIMNYEPDLLIVYDGHNEFYGALGAASQESIGTSRWVVKLYLRLVHLRMFHLVRDVLQQITRLFHGEQPRQPGGTMMERLALGQYVPYDSKKYQTCLSNFRANLQELCALCSSRGIPLILSTQASNLRNRFPFVSEFSPSVSEEQKSIYSRAAEQGTESFRHGVLTEALHSFREAERIDSLRADAHFWIALCLDSLGQKSIAKQEYIFARDYDQLRFRASSDFNQEILRCADNRKIFVCDIERRLANLSPDSLLGREFVLEHLHPTLRGYFEISRLYKDEMKSHEILAQPGEWKQQDTLTENTLWNEKAVTSLDEDAAAKRLEILTSGWPFRRQSEPLPAVPLSDTLGQIEQELVSGLTTWEEAHVKAAEFFAAKGDTRNAKMEYRAIINQIPYSVSAYLRLAQLLLRGGDIATGKTLLEHSLRIEKSFYASKTLGGIALDEGNVQAAIQYLQDAYRGTAEPRDQMNSGYLLAVAYVRAGRQDDSKRLLEHVLVLNPRFAPARELLDKIKNH